MTRRGGGLPGHGRLFPVSSENTQSVPPGQMRTLLICHHDALLNREGMARWLASFSNLAGVMILRERRERFLGRIRFEIGRVGVLRFLDVLAMRLYYRLFLQREDRRWEQEELERLRSEYPPVPDTTEFLETHSPNTSEAEEFVRRLAPDFMIARCKHLLKRRVFSIPRHGTFVLHPGICPEYRNAHGSFWALAEDDRERVGMTLLRIDEGVDTGPVYGYYSYDFDEREESHIRIQQRVVMENLSAIAEKLRDIHAGAADPVDTSGRESGAWGHPWLSKYLSWKGRARRRHASA